MKPPAPVTRMRTCSDMCSSLHWIAHKQASTACTLPQGHSINSKMTSMSHNVFKIRPQAAVWQCDRMPSQTQWISGAPHSCYGAASYGHGYLFAPVRHAAVSRHARYVERSSPSHLVLAQRHAGPVSRAENLGRTGSLDAGLDHR